MKLWGRVTPKDSAEPVQTTEPWDPHGERWPRVGRAASPGEFLARSSHNCILRLPLSRSICLGQSFPAHRPCLPSPDEFQACLRIEDNLTTAPWAIGLPCFEHCHPAQSPVPPAAGRTLGPACVPVFSGWPWVFPSRTEPPICSACASTHPILCAVFDLPREASDSPPPTEQTAPVDRGRAGSVLSWGSDSRESDDING